MQVATLNEVELVEASGLRFGFPISSATGTGDTAVVSFELDPGAVLPVHTDSAEELLLVLEGVAISGDSRVALLRDPRGNNLVQVAEGSVHNGWTLESLEGGKAVFRRGDDVTELSIEVAPDTQTPQRRRPR